MHELGWYVDDISIVAVHNMAEFQVEPASPAVGEPALFTDRSSGPVIGWSWSFGDGGTSFEQNPTHAFSTDGLYEVILTAIYADGELQRTRWVSVGDAGNVFGDGFESGDIDAWSGVNP